MRKKIKRYSNDRNSTKRVVKDYNKPRLKCDHTSDAFRDSSESK